MQLSNIKLYRRILILILLSCTSQVFAQFAAEKSAFKLLGKHKWEQSRRKLTKIQRKDSTRAAVYYILSCYFFSPDNPSYHLDTAYRYAVKAQQLYDSAAERDREKWKRLPLDSMVLAALQARLDSAGFTRACAADTEQAYQYFLQYFPGAAQHTQAQALRDAAAFRAARANDTYDAYKHFLDNYPQAEQVPEAKKRYERLLFLEKTQDKRIKSYEAFLRQYPQSPHRHQAEEELFEIITAGGTAQQFITFLKRYPNGGGSRKARNILYYLLRNDQGVLPLISIPAMNDSLRDMIQRNAGYLVPFYEDGKYGFMDHAGKEVMPPSATRLPADYLCGNIGDDMLIFPEEIRARNGAIIYTGVIDQVEEMGMGFIQITAGHCLHVLHKSGFTMDDRCVEESRLLLDRFVATRVHDQWTIYTLAGRVLIDSIEAVEELNDVLAIQQQHTWSLVLPDQLARVANQETLQTLSGFDQVKAWPDEQIWVAREDTEGVLASDLSLRVPMAHHKLEPAYHGVRAVTQEGVRFYSPGSGMSASFQQVLTSRPWVGVKTTDGWRLFAPDTQTFLSEPMDSLCFQGLFAVLYRQDSMRVFLSHEKWLDFPRGEVAFISAKDSTAFLRVDRDDHKAIYSLRGEKLFSLVCDQITYVQEGIFIFSRNDKKGLISQDGKILLPVDYQAIGEVEGRWMPLLKKTKFGFFCLDDYKTISPAYDKNLKYYHGTWFIAFKDGKYGVIDDQRKQVLPFVYDDIRYWNDSIALVKKDAGWHLLDIASAEVRLDQIRDVTMVKDTKEESVAIVRSDSGYGVLSSICGIVIPLSFTDIVNVGSATVPLYFTEKYVKEADIFVVIYYDAQGELLRRQAIDTNEYDRIYCPD